MKTTRQPIAFVCRACACMDMTRCARAESYAEQRPDRIVADFSVVRLAGLDCGWFSPRVEVAA